MLQRFSLLVSDLERGGVHLENQLPCPWDEIQTTRSCSLEAERIIGPKFP